MAATSGIEVKGLREAAKALKKADVADKEVSEAMKGVGGILVREAWRLAPVKSGKLAGSIKTTGGRNALDFKAGNNTTIKYAWWFHAPAGRATGYMGRGPAQKEWIFRIPPHKRSRTGRTGKGGPVHAYSARRRVPNRPFMFQAWERKQRDVLEAYADAIAGLFRGAGRG